jgi:hypothetical protein
LERDRLAIPDLNKKYRHLRGRRAESKKDVTWGQANSTGMPPNKKINKAE